MLFLFIIQAIGALSISISIQFNDIIRLSSLIWLAMVSFTELMPMALIALCTFMRRRYGKPTGISYIDATDLSVCTLPRARRHKTFALESGWGKYSTGWFFGFKLHLIINDKGELLNVKCTVGTVDDRSILDDMYSHLFGKLFGDRVYFEREGGADPPVSQRRQKNRGYNATNTHT